jgi:putative DNA primase/helicase
MGDSESMVRYLQRAFGYALTGDVSEQCLFFFVGDGSNGKTTLLEVIRTMLGDYARQAETKSLVARGRDGIPNDVARLAGARFVVASEIGQGRRLEEAVVKPLTGGDTILARYLYGEFFEFEAQFKWFVALNHLPIVQDLTEGMWRRIKVIRFPVRISEQEKDKHLKQKLLAEGPGILNWLVTGCLDWQETGLGEPATVTTAVSNYRAEMGSSTRFIEERCCISHSVRVGVSSLYEAYATWCKQRNQSTWSMKDFNKSLRERGFETTHTEKGNVWNGIILNQEG